MSYYIYRYLYSLPSEGNKIAIAEINRLSTDFLKSKNHNIELVFTRLISTNIDDNIAQIIMCLIVTASRNIYGDAVIKVELEMQNDNFIGIKIVVTAPNLRCDQDRADILLGKRTIDDVSIEMFTNITLTT